MRSVVVIFGTRPEAIKMAPVVRELQRLPDQFSTHVWVTAQHRQMLDQVLDLFHIEPDLDLDIMQHAQSPSQVAAAILQRLEPCLIEAKPDWVLVQGDTTTVMATAITAHHLRIKVGHVEAGLRTHDKLNPFPEEMNRIVADAISDLHFAPTAQARANLLSEGIAQEGISVTGNTVIDALQWIVRQPCPASADLLLRDIGIAGRDSDPKLILITAHRRESFGEPLRNICTALKRLAESRPEIHIVYPVHLNPNVQSTVHTMLDGVPNITLLPPLDYQSLAHLLQASYLVLTDSGGLQEEAPSLGKPVLVLRQTTERPEAVEAGTAKLVGTETDTIVSEACRLLDNMSAYRAMALAVNPFGDGHAAERIVKALLKAERF